MVYIEFLVGILVTTDPPTPCHPNTCYNEGSGSNVQDVFQGKGTKEHVGTFCQTSKYRNYCAQCVFGCDSKIIIVLRLYLYSVMPF